MTLQKIDQFSLEPACEQLASSDPGMADILTEFGYPPLWRRAPGFATLVLIILEQQVSLDSARSVYRRLNRQLGGISVSGVARLCEQDLRRAGITRQKAGYIHALASAIDGRQMRLSSLSRASDSDARNRLLQLKGVGPWTADVYLLFALCRADIWPPGDIALIRSVAEAYPSIPAPDNQACIELAETWRPLRSVAARMLWHAYLCRRGRGMPQPGRRD